MTCHLKVGVDGVKLFGVLWQLSPDVLQADEDALEVGPGALHLEPDGDDRVKVASFFCQLETCSRK